MEDKNGRITECLGTVETSSFLRRIGSGNTCFDKLNWSIQHSVESFQNKFRKQGLAKIETEIFLQIKVVAVASLLVLASCGSNSKKEELKTIDSVGKTALKIPEELKVINEQLLANPLDAELYHKRAKYYFEKMEFDAGFMDMAQALKIDSSKAEYFITLSDLYFVTNQTGKSKAALEKCIQLDDKNVNAILKLGELYMYVSKHEKSMEYINKALKIDKYNAKAYFMKGMNYKEMKDTVRAISSMQTAVEQDQQYYQAYMQLGILTAAKRNPLAIQYYKNAIRLQPKSVEAWYDMGKYYQDMQDWDNALATYSELIKINNNKFAHYNMGVIHLINLKKYAEAIMHFSEVIKIDPDNVEAYFGRGVCYQSAGNVKLALSDFQACLKIDPNHLPALNSLKELKGK